MQQPSFSVSELIAVINQTLDYAYPAVIVEGEVASFKVSKSKYVFFDLKDDAGVIGCFMMIYQLRIPLEDGMRVRVIAQPQLTAWGKFSLTVREVMPMGEGTIRRAFDLLKAKLDADGLFDPARKRTLPRIPIRVGVVASVESAGYADFVKILGQRWGGLDIQVADVQVQGAAASQQIIGALDHFNQQPNMPDVLVVIRGGGSAEDLSVFNEEPLVRAIAASRIPTLVGVGHETDTSLCDLASDVRAATPSNAAQILVPDQQELLRDIAQRSKHLLQVLGRYIDDASGRVREVGGNMLEQVQRALTDSMQRLRHTDLLLKQLDPNVVLNRGYALVRSKKGELVRGSVTNVKVGDELTVTTSHAIISVGVKDVRQQEN